MITKIVTEFIKNKRTVLRSQQRFTRQKHNVYPKEVKKIGNNGKRIQSVDSIETNVYGTNIQEKNTKNGENYADRTGEN